MNKKMFCPVHAYTCFTKWAGPAVLSVVLLIMRIIWGWQFHVAGMSKLHDIAKPIKFFTELGIPMPVANAWLVACVEFGGGLLLLLGLGGRLAALNLTINMTVAYLTADHEAVVALFKEGETAKFFAAAPFWFLFTSVLVLACGPGWFSIDGIINGIRCRRAAKDGEIKIQIPK